MERQNGVVVAVVVVGVVQADAQVGLLQTWDGHGRVDDRGAVNVSSEADRCDGHDLGDLASALRRAEQNRVGC